MRKVLLPVLLLLLVAAGAYLARQPQIFRIRHIECYTQFSPCQPELMDRAQFLLGRPIYLPLPRKEIAQNYSGIPSISEVAAYRRLPATVVLGVSVRRPLAVVLGASQERVVVDETGMVFAPIDRSALPTLWLEGEVSAGTQLDPDQLMASSLLSQVAAIVGEQVQGRLVYDDLIVTTSRGVEIILDIHLPTNGWDASLQSILTRSKIDGKLMRRIDLRFKSPAVSF